MAVTGVLAAVGIASARRSRGAHSAASTLTWQAAARSARFPVYRPEETLGLKLSVLTLSHGCLLGAWGTSKGPHFALGEPGDSVQCGQPGVASSVATTIINGVRVPVLVQCRSFPRCTIRDGERNGELLLFVPERNPAHYAIQLQSMHVALSGFLKIARSFRRVR